MFNRTFSVLLFLEPLRFSNTFRQTICGRLIMLQLLSTHLHSINNLHQFPFSISRYPIDDLPYTLFFEKYSPTQSYTRNFKTSFHFQFHLVYSYTKPFLYILFASSSSSTNSFKSPSIATRLACNLPILTKWFPSITIHHKTKLIGTNS